MKHEIFLFIWNSFIAGLHLQSTSLKDFAFYIFNQMPSCSLSDSCMYQCLLFLVACTRLYTSLCWSVGWLVGRSVCLLVTHLLFWRFSGSFRITAPAQSHATNSAVYPALFKVRSIALSFQNMRLEFLKFLLH